MNILSGKYWRKGTSRSINEDSLTFQQVQTSVGDTVLAAVCDGIGGLSCGEAASGYAAAHMTEWFYSEWSRLIFSRASPELVLLALQRQVLQIQENLLNIQVKDNLQMGTTMTMLLMDRHRYFLVHLGDSRVYMIRKGTLFSKVRIRCLTKDDQDSKGNLTKCLGMSGLDKAYYTWGYLKPDTGFLLCTDGFYKMSCKEEFARVMNPVKIKSSCQIERRLEILQEQSEKKRETDDMTAVYFVKKGKNRWKNK